MVKRWTDPAETRGAPGTAPLNTVPRLNIRGMASRVALAHPLVELEVYLHRSGSRIGLFYQPGLESPQRRHREYPWGRQYSAVFRDATTPTDDRLVRKLRWLAGLEEQAYVRAAIT